MRIVQVHLNIINSIRKVLKEKKSPKGLVMFFKQLSVAYFKFLKNEYARLFLYLDPEFRKTIKKARDTEKLKRYLIHAVKLLNYIDVKMEQAGMPRWKIRQVWRDFERNKDMRKEMFDELLKEINKI